MRILFVTATRIGDAVLSTGLLAELLRTHPGAAVTIACGPVTASLFADVPGLQRIIPLAKRFAHAHWLNLWLKTVAQRWDIVVDIRASLLSYCLWARRRLVLLPHPELGHRVQELGSLLGRAQAPPAPCVWISRAAEAAAERAIPAGSPVLALGPIANWRGKEWRIERYAELARRLTGPHGPLAGGRVAVLAMADERAAVMPLLASMAEADRIDLVGKFALPTVAACLKRASLFIGNDSGLMHMAAAAGTPTLGLYGPSLPERFRPWGPHTAFVRTELSYAELVGGPCYNHRTTGTLMDSLPIDSVEQAALGLLRRVRELAA
jgi:heptosyltransferase III